MERARVNLDESLPRPDPPHQYVSSSSREKWRDKCRLSNAYSSRTCTKGQCGIRPHADVTESDRTGGASQTARSAGARALRRRACRTATRTNTTCVPARPAGKADRQPAVRISVQWDVRRAKEGSGHHTSESRTPLYGRVAHLGSKRCHRMPPHTPSQDTRHPASRLSRFPLRWRNKLAGPPGLRGILWSAKSNTGPSWGALLTQPASPRWRPSRSLPGMTPDPRCQRRHGRTLDAIESRFVQRNPVGVWLTLCGIPTSPSSTAQW